MTLISNLQHWWRQRSEADWSNATDTELLQRYIGNSAAGAMDELIHRHGDALYHFLLTLSDAVLAEDISQQSWLKLIEKPERYQHQAAQFRTWLFTIGRHAVIDELRRQQRWQWQDLADTDESDLPHWQEELAFTDQPGLSESFNQSLEALPFHQREAITLQLEDFSLLDIASITGEKQETIKSRLRFAKARLKKALEVHHDQTR